MKKKNKNNLSNFLSGNIPCFRKIGCSIIKEKIVKKLLYLQN